MEIIDYSKVQLHRSAVALGKFQGLHRGHMLLIDKIVSLSKEEGISSVVFTINMPSDRMIHLPEERHAILRKKGVDTAVECEFSSDFAAMTPEEFVRRILVEKLHASYVVVGEDFKFGFNRQGNVDRLRVFGIQYGFRVIAFKKLSVEGTVVSSSCLRDLIEQGRMDLVSRYMGRDYSITGIVRHGKQLGRTIGFPTVNILPEEAKLLPPYGVYESLVAVDGRLYTGITNIGDNPTVDDGEQVKVETNILDYSGDLYGREITVSVRRFIRPEIKFHSIEELQRQIERDRQSVMHQ